MKKKKKKTWPEFECLPLWLLLLLMSGFFNADLSVERHVTGGGIWQEGMWDWCGVGVGGGENYT